MTLWAKPRIRKVESSLLQLAGMYVYFVQVHVNSLANSKVWPVHHIAMLADMNPVHVHSRDVK